MACATKRSAAPVVDLEGRELVGAGALPIPARDAADLIKRGLFPRPIAGTGRRKLWRADQVERWASRWRGAAD